ncbi:hypothetical protein Forpe1208_v004337 [Fusarium oxysporum f. sp. rapae]|uniref:Uncharacterized protein n=1 Tax=Fusarium oxysporum f. sp. rapae TaxID=485398 RepID=A0A8J5PEH5_FUSOX|nr:hypothetical protein Forpe1208_v004337 [Fusarium oxysporum f. sp. rapae]
MTSHLPSSSNSLANARPFSPDQPSSRMTAPGGQSSMTSFVRMVSGARPRRLRTLRPGQSLAQHAQSCQRTKKKANVSITIRCDPEGLRSQTTPGLRDRYKNREEDIFKLIVALYLDDRRVGVITLVVDSPYNAQQISDHSELIREAFEYQFEIIPDKFHILSTDITKKGLADRLAGTGANINYESLFEDLPSRL